ncbi:hypothetical protein AMECASPLE_031946 [Ameca splendens]|uniref:Lens epithelium-derived growth factor integrase-binding domain-containing protein n=1 Tax=Ameca splendens TaxID=208324 RepID=A0ABV0ZRA0_9TELE
MRFYRANQAIMDKASMLYNRFKNAFLVGEGEEGVSAAFLRSLLQEKEREETQRVELWKEKFQKKKKEEEKEASRCRGEVEKMETQAPLDSSQDPKLAGQNPL